MSPRVDANEGVGVRLWIAVVSWLLVGTSLVVSVHLGATSGLRSQAPALAVFALGVAGLVGASVGWRGSSVPWYRSRRWLLVLALSLPMVLGTTLTALVGVASSGPDRCDAADVQLLWDSAHDLAARVDGLRLGEAGGCDSGDPASIAWEHDSLDDLVGEAKDAGCTDADVEEWDEEEHYLACGSGSSRIGVSIELDTDLPAVSGSIWLDS